MLVDYITNVFHLFILFVFVQRGDEVDIICVGSVFKSWKLMEQSFLDHLGVHQIKMNIRFLTQSSAIGAVYYASKHFGYELNIEFKQNYKQLCCYHKGNIVD